MRATLLENNPDISAILHTVFGLAGIPLHIVFDEQEILVKEEKTIINAASSYYLLRQ